MHHATSDVPTAMLLKIQVFWDATPYLYVTPMFREITTQKTFNFSTYHTNNKPTRDNAHKRKKWPCINTPNGFRTQDPTFDSNAVRSLNFPTTLITYFKYRQYEIERIYTGCFFFASLNTKAVALCSGEWRLSNR